jgi:hypothetical protein
MPLEIIREMTEFGNLQRREFSGKAVDISPDGLGLITDVQLEPGAFIQIRHENTVQTAQVKWMGLMDGKYRVGVLIYKDR